MVTPLTAPMVGRMSTTTGVSPKICSRTCDASMALLTADSESALTISTRSMASSGRRRANSGIPLTTSAIVRLGGQRVRQRQRSRSSEMRPSNRSRTYPPDANVSTSRPASAMYSSTKATMMRARSEMSRRVRSGSGASCDRNGVDATARRARWSAGGCDSLGEAVLGGETCSSVSSLLAAKAATSPLHRLGDGCGGRRSLGSRVGGGRCSSATPRDSQPTASSRGVRIGGAVSCRTNYGSLGYSRLCVERWSNEPCCVRSRKFMDLCSEMLIQVHIEIIIAA